MRKGILALLIISIIFVVTISSMVSPKRETISLAAETPKNLVNNGMFQDGLNGWQIVSSSEKPQYDFVQTPEVPANALAIVAEQQGSTRLSQQVTTDTTFVRFHFKANFLSTRGDGQIRIKAIDANNQTVATLGWAVVGDLPANGPSAKWFDLRVPQNYLGDWVVQDIQLAEQFNHAFPHIDTSAVRSYQIDFIVTDGQHGIVTDVQLLENRRSGLVTEITELPSVRSVGEDFTVTTTVINRDSRPQKDILVNAVEPFGWGVVIKEPKQRIEILHPGESKTLSWIVTAQRASLANLGKPWELAFQVEGGQPPVKCMVEVQDRQPGRIYYILTDDLEPIDGAGYAKTYGNQNAWLDPEEFKIQLVQKAERLNEIADVHGAKWSHYIAWPALVGAEWASTQSKTGRWPEVIESVKQSVQSQSIKGHEYAVHMHSDYDPRLPGNILRYNVDLDGFWANHRRHGWAHSLPEVDTFENIASRTGTLFDYYSRLSYLTRRSPLGQIVATRVGSFDFGDTAIEEAKSMEAYHRVGLLAGSDADGNIGGISAGQFLKSMYLTSTDDINKPTQDLHKVGILQFRPNPVNYIAYDVDSASALNQKVAEGVQAYMDQDKVKPGIHAIVGFTHTMFIMGVGDWRSVEGGQFTQIDQHLAYVKNLFVQPGIVHFATSSELAKAYWDYYTPNLLAVYGPEQAQERGRYEYQIQLIGRQIPADNRHIHQVSVKYPLYLREKAYKVEVRKDGCTIMHTYGLPTPFNDVIFPVDDKEAKYTLHVYTDPTTAKIVHLMRWFHGKMIYFKKIIA